MPRFLQRSLIAILVLIVLLATVQGTVRYLAQAEPLVAIGVGAVVVAGAGVWSSIRFRRSARTPFRNWGTALIIGDIALLLSRAWLPAASIAGVAFVYWLLVRLARCRVETMNHRPCMWRVRGFVGTCDYHVGYKRGLPTLRTPDLGGIPVLMWRRPTFRDQAAFQRPYQEPPGPQAVAERAIRRPPYDWIMLIIAVLGLVASYLFPILDR